jgi:hypothetical protein
MTRGQGRRSQDTGGGSGIETDADFVVRFSRVISSSLAAENQALQYNVEGLIGFDVTGENLVFEPESGEATEAAEVFGQLGVVARPLPPESAGGVDEHLEVVCIRTTDALIPIAHRDVRLKMQGGAAPGQGVVALLGYGGGFHSLSPVADGTDLDGGGTIHVIYCPFDFDSDGVAQKAHSITMDPTPGNESMSLVHADGMAVLMFDDKLTLRSNDGSGYIELSGSDVVINGNVSIVGALKIGDIGLGPLFPVALVGFPPGTPLLGGPSVLASSAG